MQVIDVLQIKFTTSSKNNLIHFVGYHDLGDVAGQPTTHPGQEPGVQCAQAPQESAVILAAPPCGRGAPLYQHNNAVDRPRRLQRRGQQGIASVRGNEEVGKFLCNYFHQKK